MTLVRGKLRLLLHSMLTFSVFERLDYVKLVCADLKRLFVTSDDLMIGLFLLLLRCR